MSRLTFFNLPAEIRNQIYSGALTESDGQSTPINIGSLVGNSTADFSVLPFVPGRREVPLLYASATIRREAFGIWLSKQNFLFRDKDDLRRFGVLLGDLRNLLRSHERLRIIDSEGKDTGRLGLTVLGSILW